MAEIKTLLDDVIETEIRNLKQFSSDDEGKADAIRDLAALHKLRIEEIKAQTDAEEKAQRREMDSEQRKAELAGKDTDRTRDEELQKCQLREQKIDRYVRVGVKGAPVEEITRAVKHSMVVIDAAKHKLDYKRSEIENDIPTLRKRWQGYVDPETGKMRGGASTLLSRRKQSVEVPERQGSGRIDKETGKVVYKESGRTYIDPKTGKTVPATTKIKLLEKVDDVRTLSSGTVQEDAYASYANRMKALANQARLEYAATPSLMRNASAAKAYAPEVERLTSALKMARLNAPREREAQRLANAQVKAKVEANNITDKDEISKIRRSAISDARVSTGADGKGTRITISDGEWEAIQAGAISDTTLKEILRYADPDVVRARATPRTTTQLSDARVNRIKAMANSGSTNREIADALGISPSAVSKYLNE